MGSYEGTCTISGLPVRRGEPVRFMLLVENPFTGRRPVSSIEVWCPRTFPLRAKYSGYGFVKDVEEGPARDIWLEALEHDTVPRGWGENTVHDVATSKKMSWEQTLDAIFERRLRVRSKVEDISHEDFEQLMKSIHEKYPATAEDERMQKVISPKQEKKPIPPGVPTRARIQKLIVDAGHRLYGDDPDDVRGGGQGGYLITKTRKGEVRVRYLHWNAKDFAGDDVELAKLLPLLGDYASMLCHGSGHHADIIIRPKPRTKDFYGDRGDGGGVKKSLEVSFAIIREDVWQALLQVQNSEMKYGNIQAFYYATDNYSAKVEKQARENEAMRTEAKDPEAQAAAEKIIAFSGGVDRMARRMGGEVIDHILGRDPIPFVLGPGTHAYLMGKKGPYPREFLRTAAEATFINSVLGWTRFVWQPTFSIGPSRGNWPLHHQVLTTLGNLAGKPPKPPKDDEDE